MPGGDDRPFSLASRRPSRGLERTPNLWWAVASLASVLTLASHARAQASGENVVRADALFTEGKRLLDENRIDLACEKLAESQQLDPGGGTLLALALCHEKQGRLVSAWTEYGEALELARDSGNGNREIVASARRAALEPKLARLTIRVPPAVASLVGLEVRCGDAIIAPDAYGNEFPVDPGEQRIVARAAGKRAFVTTAHAAAGESLVVEIQALEDIEGHARIPVRRRSAPKPRPQHADVESTGTPAVMTTGWVVGGVGVAALAVGTGFAIQALLDGADADRRCADDVPCHDPDAIELNESAMTAADVATGALIAGALTTAVGIAMIIVGKHLPNEAADPSKAGRFAVRF